LLGDAKCDDNGLVEGEVVDFPDIEERLEVEVCKTYEVPLCIARFVIVSRLSQDAIAIDGRSGKEQAQADPHTRYQWI
jgi:hypothetical protein